MARRRWAAGSLSINSFGFHRIIYSSRIEFGNPVRSSNRFTGRAKEREAKPDPMACDFHSSHQDSFSPVFFSLWILISSKINTPGSNRTSRVLEIAPKFFYTSFSTLYSGNGLFRETTGNVKKSISPLKTYAGLKLNPYPITPKYFTPEDRGKNRSKKGAEKNKSRDAASQS